MEIQRACRRLGLELVEVCRDEPDGAAVPRRGFERALREIHAGGATCLVVSGLAQLGADADELSSTLARLERDGARLVAVDVGFDSATPAGRVALGGAGVEAAPVEKEAAVEEPPTRRRSRSRSERSRSRSVRGRSGRRGPR